MLKGDARLVPPSRRHDFSHNGLLNGDVMLVPRSWICNDVGDVMLVPPSHHDPSHNGMVDSDVPPIKVCLMVL